MKKIKKELILTSMLCFGLLFTTGCKKDNNQISHDENDQNEIIGNDGRGDLDLSAGNFNVDEDQISNRINLRGSVNYDFGHATERPVDCSLELEFNEGSVSGYCSYADGCDVTGTIKEKNDGTYHLDVYFIDNSGIDFDGTYNPKTGVFSGQFMGRGMEKSYSFRFVES